MGDCGDSCDPILVRCGDDCFRAESRRQLLVEGFEDPSFPPLGWESRTTNHLHEDFGHASQRWRLVMDAPHRGRQAAVVQGEYAIIHRIVNWLLSSPLDFSDVVKPQLRFFARRATPTSGGVATTIYRVLTSTGGQNELDSYTPAAAWTPNQLNSTWDDYEEKIVELPSSLIGEPKVRLAFQLTNNDGVGWYIDDVVVLDACVEAP